MNDMFMHVQRILCPFLVSLDRYSKHKIWEENIQNYKHKFTENINIYIYFRIFTCLTEIVVTVGNIC